MKETQLRTVIPWWSFFLRFNYWI